MNPPTPVKLMITGERRSGTTFLANFLNAQSGITIYRDSLHIGRHLARLGIPSIHTPLSEQQIKLAQKHVRENDRLGRELDVSALRFSTLLELYEQAFAVVFPQGGERVLGHKTTRAVGAARQLIEAVPDLRLVFVLRDPRAVLASALPRFQGQTAFGILREWRRALAAFTEIEADPSLSSRVFRLRFEDLLLDPEVTLGRLADFLGVSGFVDPGVLEDWTGQWVGNSSHGQITTLFDASTVSRWRSANPRAGRLAEFSLSGVMEQAGYLPDRPVTKRHRRLVRCLEIFDYLALRAGVAPRELTNLFGLCRKGNRK